ncbi:MAG: hypothetical protein IPL91_08265 [Hyphomicrobium sp.]|jgi:hypothetical protein|nr:hypothetical protein [Hyphomicrobium sp.]
MADVMGIDLVAIPARPEHMPIVVTNFFDGTERGIATSKRGKYFGAQRTAHSAQRMRANRSVATACYVELAKC